MAAVDWIALIGAVLGPIAATCVGALIGFLHKANVARWNEIRSRFIEHEKTSRKLAKRIAKVDRRLLKWEHGRYASQ